MTTDRPEVGEAELAGLREARERLLDHVASGHGWDGSAGLMFVSEAEPLVDALIRAATQQEMLREAREVIAFLRSINVSAETLSERSHARVDAVLAALAAADRGTVEAGRDDVRLIANAILGSTSYKPHREAAERVLAALSPAAPEPPEPGS